MLLALLHGSDRNPEPRHQQEASMRALIVDDHSMFCDGLKLLLNDLGAASHVASCTSSSQAISLASQEPWDLILMDWTLGERSINGAELIKRLIDLQPGSRLVVISADDLPDRVKQAIEAGASGFVPKTASGKLLIDAIQMIVDGGIYLPSCVLALGEGGKAHPQRNDNTSACAVNAAPSLREAYPTLTARQIDVLALIARGWSNKLIARELNIAEGTVKQHLNSVFRAIGTSSRTQTVCQLSTRGVKVF
jgi:DNA-binding NarL/FixJ family response regulator